MKRLWGVSAMRANTSESQASGSMLLSLAVMISVATAAARSAPRSEPANSHDLCLIVQSLAALVRKRATSTVQGRCLQGMSASRSLFGHP